MEHKKITLTDILQTLTAIGTFILALATCNNTTKIEGLGDIVTNLVSNSIALNQSANALDSTVLEMKKQLGEMQKQTGLINDQLGEFKQQTILLKNQNAVLLRQTGLINENYILNKKNSLTTIDPYFVYLSHSIHDGVTHIVFKNIGYLAIGVELGYNYDSRYEINPSLHMPNLSKNDTIAFDIKDPIELTSGDPNIHFYIQSRNINGEYLGQDAFFYTMAPPYTERPYIIEGKNIYRPQKKYLQ